jgi:dipeptidyl aminopeptidase/acylaminoacyl peptidase
MQNQPFGLILGMLMLLAVSEGATAERISLEELDRMVSVSSPRISPDGQSVVVVVSRPDLDENIDRQQLMLIDVTSGASQPLTFDRPGVSRPRWSPDGQHLAFIDVHGKDDPKEQVLVLPIEGGEARAVTSAPQGVVAFEWSAEGDAILYLGAGDAEKAPEGPERHNRSFVVGFHDYLAEQRPPSIHLWRQAMAGGKAQRINGDDIVAAGPLFAWMAVAGDGKTAAFLGFPAEHQGDFRESEMIVIDLESGKQSGGFGETLKMAFWAAFTPDGSHLAYAASNHENAFFNSPAIAVVETEGGVGRVVSKTIDRGLWGAQWMPDGKALVIGGNNEARKSLWVQPRSGPARKIDLGELNVAVGYGPAELDVANNGAMAFIASGVQQPPELFWIDDVESAPRQLTNFNEAAGSLELGEAREIRWETADGFQANGVLIYPPDFDPDKRYPLVLKIHGGPMSATTLAWDGFGQVLAARGFLVFGPNYRGSDNLGDAYQSAVINDAGEGPGRDVMSGLAAVQALGIVDESRIGVSGWSYGGYMTSWLIGNYPDVWRAAMAGAPVTEYFDSYALSDINMAFGWGFDMPPWSPEGQDLWRRQSPIAHVHQATTPTLILCNTGDLRVPITQSYKLFHALQEYDVPVQFVAYPIPGHFPGDPVHRRDVFRRWADWMELRFELPRDAAVNKPHGRP